MSRLREVVKDHENELKYGLAWIAFWKDGRGWGSQYVYLDAGSETIDPDDLWRLEQIREVDPGAVVLNGYYCGHLGEDMNTDQLTAGVRWHYENGLNTLAEFMEAHTAIMPRELIEEARQIAHAAGLPFSENPYRGEDFDPYSYDGSMTLEDYELMHTMIAQERSKERSETMSILMDRLSRFETGIRGGEWLSLPTTASQLDLAMQRMGITIDNPQDFFINGFSNTEDCPFYVPLEVIQRGSMNELNYFATLLEPQSDADKIKFVAAVAYGEHAKNLKDLINLVQNLDCYSIAPLDALELPKGAKKYFSYDLMEDERIEQGYVYRNSTPFIERYQGHDVPEQYCIVGVSQQTLHKSIPPQSKRRPSQTRSKGMEMEM